MAALHDQLSARRGRSGGLIKALACTPGVCATDMYAHASTVFRPGKVPDMAAVPSVEDGSLAQLQCCCDPGLSSGELIGPPGVGGLPVRIPLAPPTVLVDSATKQAFWRACEEAVGPF